MKSATISKVGIGTHKPLVSSSNLLAATIPLQSKASIHLFWHRIIRAIGGFVVKGIMIGCMVLAFIAAVFYVLLGAGIITVPSLASKDWQHVLVYVAGGCYILGGLLILAKKRWLWIAGLVMNTLVMAFFFIMYRNNPAVMLSLPGLGTKIPQIILEVGLVYLIATYRKKK
jgi:hypothetical protein